MKEETCFIYNIEYNEQYGFIEFFNKVLGDNCGLPSERQFLFQILDFKEL